MKATLALIIGIALIVWGAATVNRPSRVEPRSMTYLLITGALLGWSDVRQKAAEQRLTQRQIRFMGALAVLTGTGLIVAGFLGFAGL